MRYSKPANFLRFKLLSFLRAFPNDYKKMKSSATFLPNKPGYFAFVISEDYSYIKLTLKCWPKLLSCLL